jgi:N-acetylglucosaminyldiphosphoundecaprenol N-acetyl-beta-D-mannosaminyltransferase
MIADPGKKDVVGVLLDAVDYEGALQRIAAAAKERRPFAVSALAVHGVMTGYTDEEHRARLNGLDLVVPDGQPVRWALNLLYGMELSERVYGPTLMLRVCERAEREGLGIYLYGSVPMVLQRLEQSLHERFPKLRICGAEPSKFRRLSEDERAQVVNRIQASGAQITFVGLGCPRQEVWAYEYRDALSMPILAVGAAFDFHSGLTKQAPQWMQDRGLEWFYRLKTEPRRLWRRYILLNPWYASLVMAQFLRLKRFSADSDVKLPKVVSYG